ncbi:hypothetical protein CMQ_2325 [Grosmannia clavigera kw1407]|uniref:Uncharacterized protein n=1 Tax=Grosmannia clavigera (strain kw1407 / UAMH 11150) TaxID=655863 RepID=F0XJE7_GROCL|nr:uncharacterized protein CMQ_2325 [Grosmannia clavigera kw1407]EFX02276.1 hypothetical protein CMQ_2325 [Grosmannia clavigera kw1407]
MNYASMIDEKGLKKGFIVATLISTIIGTFTTGIGLYDRIRDHSRQHHTDHAQDHRIDDLEHRIDRLDRRDRLDRHDGFGGGAGYLSPNAVGDAVYAALSSAPTAIRREYEGLLASAGPRFAQGDATARLQLQALLIDLQSSVIQQLQEALDRRSYRRSSSNPRGGRVDDRYGFSSERLAEAADRARNGSIRALREQHQRLLEDSTPHRPLSHHSNDYLEYADGREDTGLFCPYALQLQRNPRTPMDLDLDGDDTAISDTTAAFCPSCAGRLEISPDYAWKIQKSVVVGQRFDRDDDDRDAGRNHHRRGASMHSHSVVDDVEDRVFVLSNRFVVKCHQTAKVVEDHESRHAGFSMLKPSYACCLCEERGRYSGRGRSSSSRVAVCSNMTNLVDHVCDEHSIKELMADPDIHEVEPRRERW